MRTFLDVCIINIEEMFRFTIGSHLLFWVADFRHISTVFPYQMLILCTLLQMHYYTGCSRPHVFLVIIGHPILHSYICKLCRRSDLYSYLFISSVTIQPHCYHCSI